MQWGRPLWGCGPREAPQPCAQNPAAAASLRTEPRSPPGTRCAKAMGCAHVTQAADPRGTSGRTAGQQGPLQKAFRGVPPALEAVGLLWAPAFLLPGPEAAEVSRVSPAALQLADSRDASFTGSRRTDLQRNSSGKRAVAPGVWPTHRPQQLRDSPQQRLPGPVRGNFLPSPGSQSLLGCSAQGWWRWPALPSDWPDRPVPECA